MHGYVVRGGFPESTLAIYDEDSFDWRLRGFYQLVDDMQPDLA